MGDDRILTIALPTFERAALLDQQFGWLSRALEGVGHRCEVFISDNCSNDDTPEVIERWRGRLPAARVSIKRNDTNIGAVRNIAQCIESATTDFVWTIGDDDRIAEDAVVRALELLDARPDLAVLILNFSSRHAKSGKVLFERCFEVAQDEVADNGRKLIERCLSSRDSARWGGLALTTALVYRTAYAREAFRSWPDGLENLTVQLYVTAYCAVLGPVLLTSDILLDCMAGTHYFLKDHRLRLGFRVADVPETWLKLAEIGYDSELCWRKARDQMSELPARYVASCFARWPLFTLHVFYRHAAARWKLRRHASVAARRPALHR
jgi:abequosyltransferase